MFGKLKVLLAFGITGKQTIISFWEIIGGWLIIFFARSLQAELTFSVGPGLTISLLVAIITHVMRIDCIVTLFGNIVCIIAITWTLQIVLCFANLLMM